MSLAHPPTAVGGLDLAAIEADLGCDSERARSFRIGDATLVVSCADEELSSWFSSPLAHLAAAPGEGPTLAVSVGSPGPSFGLATGRNGEGGWPRLRIGGGDRLRGGLWPRAGLGSLVDRELSRAAVWIRDRDRAVPADAATAVRGLLAWWSPSRAWAVVHAAAVAGAGGAALLVGGSGSGKSTSAVAAARHGLAFLGDDTVLVDLDRLEVLSLCCQANLLVDEHDEAAAADGTIREGKRFVDVRTAGIEVIARAPLRALVRPRRDPDAAPGLRALPRGEILAALAPSSLLSIPGVEADGFGSIAALVRRLPSWDLALTGSPDTDTAPLGDLLGGPR
jgi:hypothetical protein